MVMGTSWRYSQQRGIIMGSYTTMSIMSSSDCYSGANSAGALPRILGSGFAMPPKIAILMLHRGNMREPSIDAGSPWMKENVMGL